MWRRSLFLLVSGLFFLATQASGYDLTLGWNASNPADYVDGYRLYIGIASGQYGESVDAGKVKTYTVKNLDPTQHYYFAVTAYGHCTYSNDPDGHSIACESPKSNEVSWPLATVSPATAVRITEIKHMGNNFSNDPNCKALWRFESGALTTDSKGGNTLTDHNSVGTSTSDYQEGAACADLETDSAQYFSIADADLDSGYPLKSGDTNKKISVCGWFKPESDSIEQYLYTKHTPQSGKRSFAVWVNSSNQFELKIGYNSGLNTETKTLTGLTISAGYWYHWAVTYDDSDKSYKIRCRQSGQSAVEGSGNFTNNITVGDSDVAIGADGAGSTRTDGLIDEYVVSNDILASGEIDAICTQTYGVTQTVGASLDAIIQKTALNQATSLDAVLFALESEGISIDAALFALQSKAVSLDAIISGGGVYTVLDALIRASKSSGISIDAALSAPAYSNILLDALLAGTRTGGISLDAVIGAPDVGNAEVMLVRSRNRLVTAKSRVKSVVVPDRRRILSMPSRRRIITVKK